MDWLEIRVTTPPQGVELVAELFQDFGAGGVIIEDPAVIQRYAAETHPDEWAVSPFLQETVQPGVIGYFAADGALAKRMEDFTSALARLSLDPAPEMTTRTVAEEDWANAWRAYYKPVRIGKRLVVKPSWEDYSPGEGEKVIDMDPGMAFGCGTHTTTAMCLRLLEKYVKPGSTVYDVGTGSGILAIAASLLRAGRVMAVDLDPVACRAAAGNVLRNGVSGKVRVMQGNLLELVEGRANLVVSNIIASVIIDFTPNAFEALDNGGMFITSGIIRERTGEVCTALEAAGFTVLEKLEEGEWAALVAEKTAAFRLR